MSDELGFDGFDDFAAYDEPGYEPAYTPGNDSVEGLVRQLMAMVDEAQRMPISRYSRSIKLDREDTLAILQQILVLAPEEIVAARHVLKERDFILQDAERKARQVLEAAKVTAARMVEKTDVMRAARMRAEQIVADAETTARARTNEVDDHIDQYLAKVSVLADRLRQTAEVGRERLRPMLQPYDAVPPPPPPAEEMADASDWSSPPPAPAPDDDNFYDFD
jgi:vacuolar-type H+-ATPase subunit H